MTVIENQANIAKMNELESWKKQGEHCEKKTSASIMHLSQIGFKAIKNGENVIKADSVPAALK